MPDLPEHVPGDVALVLLRARYHPQLIRALQDGLGLCCSALRADRGVLFAFAPDCSYTDAVHEWVASDISSVQGGRYREAEAGEAFAAFRRGQTLALTLDESPDTFRQLRNVLREQGSLGAAFSPILEEGVLRWVLVFEWRRFFPHLNTSVLAYCDRLSEVFRAGLGREHDLKTEAEAQARMLERQKLETLGVMAGGMAHDFNNVLQSVLGLSEMLLIELPEGRTRAWAQSIRTTAARASQLTARLLSFSRQDARQRRNVAVGQSLREIVQMLERSIPEDRQIRLRVGPDLGPVRIAATDFEQAVVNLCNNASAAMPEGGTIELDAACCGDDPAWIEIRVRDEGIGMSPAEVARACEPFYTTKPAGEGTGLGLAMVKRTTEAAGGQLRIDSAPGQGTTVSLCFPRASGSVDPIDLPDAPAVEGDETILLVEDDPMVRRVAATHLERAGFEVLRAADGVAALKIYREERERIALVVADAIMPRLGGAALYARLAEEGPPPPFLFTSGYDAGHLSAEFLASPDRAFLEKPYQARQLLMCARRLLDRQQQRET